MSGNKELIKKADMVLTDLATAGKLNPEQEKRFIRKLLISPTILPSVRTVVMTGPEKKINKIGFGSRVLRAITDTGQEYDGAALPANKRVKPDLGQIALNTKEVLAEVHIPYDVLEDNIEGGNINASADESAGGLESTIVDMLAERAALDLEELALLGDTMSADTYLALHDGYLKRMTSHTVNVNGPITKDAFKNAVKTMPDQYLRNRAALKHFISVDNETEMRDQYANRPTGLGDANLTGNLPLYVFGSELKACPMMPAANGIFTDPKNLIFGIQRKITLEYDKDISRRVFIVVLTARVALQIEEEDATVKLVGIA